jgi:hypothetical protein
MPAVCNITVENDADFYRSFAYQNPDTTPVDITGASMLMGVRRLATDVTEVFELSTATGEISITDPTNGLFSIMMAQSALIQLGLGDYVHSLIITLNGIKIPVWSGSLTINAGPSR